MKAILVILTNKDGDKYDMKFINIEEIKDEIQYYYNVTDKLETIKYSGHQYGIPFYRLILG